MMIMVPWSEFARNGSKYSKELEAGKEILIVKNSKPLAIVKPVDPDSVTITVEVADG